VSSKKEYHHRCWLHAHFTKKRSGTSEISATNGIEQLAGKAKMSEYVLKRINIHFYEVTKMLMDTTRALDLFEPCNDKAQTAHELMVLNRANPFGTPNADLVLRKTCVQMISESCNRETCV
jgi:hypothetical protein